MRSAQRAQVLVYLAVTLPVFMAMVGLAIDGALLLTARRELQSVVDGAARAGATRLDVESLRGGGDGDVKLDAVRARAASVSYLEQSLDADIAWHAQPTVHVEVGRVRVRVAVDGELRTAFLRVVGVDRVPVAATADADVQYGIRGPGQT
jgi:Flp pilus assembly protein TadG